MFAHLWASNNCTHQQLKTKMFHRINDFFTACAERTFNGAYFKFLYPSIEYCFNFEFDSNLLRLSSGNKRSSSRKLSVDNIAKSSFLRSGINMFIITFTTASYNIKCQISYFDNICYWNPIKFTSILLRIQILTQTI